MVSRLARLEQEVPTREKRSVALVSLLAAGFLTALKLVVGLMSGSLGMLSEGAHSALDSIAALTTYLSIRLADKPADSSHPFGHGKFEHLSAFIETGLLLITCAWIFLDAVRRLFFNAVHVHPTLWAFGAMAVSMVVDVARSRSLSRAAKKYGSQALEADALHFSTDVYSSAAVIGGLALVAIAHHWHIRWLRAADPAAALVVAAIIVYISVRLGKRTVDALTDAAPEGTLARISDAVAGVPGVLTNERIRVRQSGKQLFVDLRLKLHSNIPLEHAQAVEDAVASKVRDLFPDADIVIQSSPQEPLASDLVDKILAIAHRNNFQVHDVTPYEIAGRVKLNLDLELDTRLTLEAAHERATVLEADIKQEMPQVSDVNVHIEPMRCQVESASEANSLKPGMERKLLAIARDTPGLVDCHSLVADKVGENILVSLHCTLEPDLPLSRVHEITEELELKFRSEFPQITKASIHAEPRGQG
jgi:cation diffusion facilitator family transporter